MATTKSDYQKIRDKFYECRNFEINNLWQKSVLLTAFIVLTFTLYAAIVPKLFDEDLGRIIFIIINEICTGISLIGLVFSIIWIMMGKGSKAWYELYENAIWNVERESKIEIPEEYAMGRNETFSNPDSNIFTVKGGKYSPSKLNIFIGKVFMIIWTITFVIHIIEIIKSILVLINEKNCPCVHCVITTLLVVLFFVIYFTAICNTWAKSTFFGD